MSFSKVHLFGRDFVSAASVEEVADRIIEDGVNRTGNEFLVTPNASVLVAYAEPRYHYIRDFYANASYILPDGMPIVWLSKLKGRQLQNRLTGSDLFPALWKRIKERQFRATLILPSEEMTALFQKDYIHANTIVPEFFDASDKAYVKQFVQEAASAVINNKSGYVFLGLSFPKQEMLAMEIAKRLEQEHYEHGVLFLLLGASYEFYFGLKKRAPAIYRKTGLEWLYRFMQEPGRLWKRYTVGNIRFLNLAIRELIKGKK